MQKKDSNKACMAPPADADPVIFCDTGTADENAPGAITFENLFDLEEIQNLQDLFAKATGVACQILRPDGTFITEQSNYCCLCAKIIRGNEKGLAKCTQSDTSLRELNPEGINIYRCGSAGLLEAGAPICIGGRHIATWGLGQVCDGTQTEAGIRAYAREIGADEDAAANAFKDVTVMSRERFEDVARMMHALANQLAAKGYQNFQKTQLIEDHKRTQEKLVQFESLLADNTLDVIWTMNMDLTFTYVNPSICTLTGFSPEEWIGNPLEEHCSASAFAVIQKIIEKEIALGAEHHRGVIFETDLLRKDGSAIEVEIHSKINFAPDGRPFMLQGTTRDISTRKQADAKLKSQKQMLELIINSVPINIFWKDMDSVYTGCNIKFAKSAGKQNVDDVVGNRDVDLIWSNEAQKYLDDDKEVLTTGTPKLGYEQCYMLPDESKVWWYTSKIPLRDNNGRVIGLLAVSEDITERKMAEQTLHRQRERLDYVIEASRLGTWAWNIKDDTAEFNEMWATLLGHTMDKIGPSSYELWKSLGHPEDVPKIEALLQQCASGEMLDYSSEFRMRHKNGRWVWILDRGRVMTYDAEGQPLEMFGTHTDITPLKQAEQELRESEAKFRSYVEQSPHGVFIADESGHYVDTNPAASQLTGYTRDELLKMNTRDIVPPDGREAGAAHFAQILKQGFANDVLPYIRKDGTRRLWNVTAVRLNKERFLGFVQDVTEREQMEQQLRAAQKLDAVGKLAGGIAHDFNNILTGIMGYTDLCLDEIEEGHPVQTMLKQIMHEAQRSADIVRQLLAFSRKQTIAPRVLNLNDAVENILKLLRQLIGEDIDLLWKPGRCLEAIKIDPGQVDQILTNLCVNARDAIDDVGKITIETANTKLDEDYCATHVEFQPGNFVMLAVSDSGVGMDTETLSNIFDPFFTTKPEGEGTGLGLATVYGIIKQNNGSINVYSEPGGGTTFRIYFPSCKSTPNHSAGKKVSKPTAARGETLLVVEDQHAICEIMCRFLKPLGYTVYTAETPARALEIMDESSGAIDALITDVVMPGMNGRQLAEKLQAIKPELKVLYMSGYTADVVAHRGILEEGVNFLSKPITRDALTKKLRDMLDGNELP